ncbi:hypothetical protein G6F22_021968 [Rhizopus arrhizus]|nr:hypothetical protein G6F22_021968 [Rhizopus arrhizus]KAG1242803.1 hypothetical protein G6F65_022816 [Rhizopus arrhizus]
MYGPLSPICPTHSKDSFTPSDTDCLIQMASGRSTQRAQAAAAAAKATPSSNQVANENGLRTSSGTGRPGAAGAAGAATGGVMGLGVIGTAQRK